MEKASEDFAVNPSVSRGSAPFPVEGAICPREGASTRGAEGGQAALGTRSCYWDMFQPVYFQRPQLSGAHLMWFSAARS